MLALAAGRRGQGVGVHGHLQSCRRCKKTLREPVTCTTGKQRYLNAVAEDIVDLWALAPITHVAAFLGVEWALVKEIFKTPLTWRLKQRLLRNVRLIAVEELASHKGQRYETVVLALETGQILYADQDRGAGALIPLPCKLKQASAYLDAGGLDM